MNNSPTRQVLLGMLLLLLAGSLEANAQNEVAPVTHTFAVTGATIITSPGMLLENATVVVRDGIIESVGTSVEVPYDAKVIRGDSLFVYAGFIDGLGYIGVPKAADDARQADAPDDPGNPSNEQAGIQPERSAMDFIDASQKSITDFRNAGVAIAHVVPRGQMLPGSGSIVSLTEDVKAGVLRNDVSMFMQFVGARRMYPGTPMGIMAKFRNLYRQAALEKDWESNFRTNPSGIRRPPNTPAHSAFFPVLDGSQPVFMMANDVLTTYRAQRLQQELGFDLVLTGIGQASEMIQELADSGEQLVLTMKLPKKPKKEKKDTKDDSTKDDSTKTVDKGRNEPSSYNPELRTSSFADVAAEAENLKARKSATYTRYLETAAALEKAGVRFAFSTADIEAKDFRSNLLQMVDVGLSEEAALAALTINAATILGIDKSAGSVQQGKLANLVISSGPYFKEKSFVQYMIVDGTLFNYEAPKPKKSDSADSSSTDESAIPGTWRYLVEIDGEPFVGQFTINNGGGSWSGTIEGDNLPTTDLIDIEVDGLNVTFGFAVPDLGRASFDGAFDGDSAAVTIDLPGLGSFPSNISRVSTPD